jgi:hypothetical protein
MAAISNDHEMKRALDKLDALQQRVAGALFVQNVLDLASDDRIGKAIQVALNAGSDEADLKAALKTVNAAVLDGHTHCGAEGDWKEQANYFVARAASACLAPQILKEGKAPAWQAALSSRMARTSAAIDSDSAPEQENAKQFEILSAYLDNL